MKKSPLLFFAFLILSCGKKEIVPQFAAEENYKVAPYDTAAVDSFSGGAISVDVARKIRMTSQVYQDSLREVRKKLEAEKVLQKEKAEKDKIAGKLEDELKKTEAAKAKKDLNKPAGNVTNP